MSKYGRHILEVAALCGAKDIVREIILHSAKNSQYISQTILNESLLLTSDHKTADILLKAGADINAKNEYGETTLVRSVRSLVKNHSMIKLLLNNDANPDLVDNRNKNALAHAIERQDIAALDLPNEEFSSFISVFCDNIEKTTKGNKTIFSH